jgi:hypothetical protein
VQDLLVGKHERRLLAVSTDMNGHDSSRTGGARAAQFPNSMPPA